MTLDVSDDSQMIASGSADKNVRLWSTQFGNCLRSLKAHNESVMQARKPEGDGKPFEGSKGWEAENSVRW